MPSKTTEMDLTLEQFLAKYLDEFSKDGYRDEWEAYLKARWKWITSKNDPQAWKEATDAYKKIPNRPR